MMKFSNAARLAALCACALATTAHAATQAYWRFEDKNGLPGVAGDFLRSTPAPGGTASGGNIVDITSDTSGNGNELRTFHSPNDPNNPDGAQRLETSPTYTLSTPSLVVPQTLAPNLLAMDFDAAPGSGPPAPPDAGGDDIFSRDQENAAGPLNAFDFDQYTIEGAFRMDAGNRFQSVLVKDGNVGGGGVINPAGPLPGIVVKVFNNNTLHIETFDGGGGFHNLGADAALTTGQWYKFAVVNDGALLQLYLDSGAGYVLQADQQAVSGGALWQTDAPWSVGRGWFNGPQDFFDGQIDEIRISDVPLSPSQFLFNAIPEPATAALAVLGLGVCVSARRQCHK